LHTLVSTCDLLSFYKFFNPMTPPALLALIVFLFCVSLLAYIYVGYPLIVILLAKFFRRPVQKRAILPSVTIVIPTFNEEVVIKEKLENTLQLDYPRDLLQILVCDDASDDRTAELVRAYASSGVELSQAASRSGKVGGLNRALQLASGEIFIIADADILPNPDALRNLIANFGDEAVGCVMAQTKMAASGEGTGESSGLYWRYEARIRQSESDIHSTVAATGHFMALRRKLVRPIPMHVILDDFYLAMMTIRQGYRVISEPQAVVWERPTQSMGDEVNRRSRLITGRFQIITMSREYLPHLPFLLQFEVISHKFLRLAIPHLMIAALLSNILFVVIGMRAGAPSFWTLVMGAALILQGIFYGLAIAGKVLFGRLSKRSKVIKVLMLPYYLCATNFAGLSGLADFISGRRTVLWQQASRR
jgi:cellulose synthase/poly-beta-1,6-N-acetylglucosamine synthase-like glycosyltransferase